MLSFLRTAGTLIDYMVSKEPDPETNDVNETTRVIFSRNREKEVKKEEKESNEEEEVVENIVIVEEEVNMKKMVSVQFPALNWIAEKIVGFEEEGKKIDSTNNIVVEEVDEEDEKEIEIVVGESDEDEETFEVVDEFGDNIGLENEVKKLLVEEKNVEKESKTVKEEIDRFEEESERLKDYRREMEKVQEELNLEISKEILVLDDLEKKNIELVNEKDRLYEEETVSKKESLEKSKEFLMSMINIKNDDIGDDDILDIDLDLDEDENMGEDESIFNLPRLEIAKIDDSGDKEEKKIEKEINKEEEKIDNEKKEIKGGEVKQDENNEDEDDYDDMPPLEKAIVDTSELNEMLNN